MLDDLDRAVLHALHVDGRAPFGRIAAVLGVSAQTVARRYQRLRAEAGLRVVGLVEAHRGGLAQWMVRLTASPRTAQDLARALARRPDTSWVKLASGGTEIFTIVHTRADAAGHPLLLQDIPRTASVTSVSAHYVLHVYLGGPTAWRGLASALTEAQQEELRHPVTGDPPHRPAGDADAALLAALRADGRTSVHDLAAATGWSATTVTRRLTELRTSGTVFFDVEVDGAQLGVTTQALLWMSVPPAHLDRVATALAGHDELAYVAATTGPTNLVADALCADPAALHRYLTHRLGALEEIRSLETAPVLRTVKATGPVLASLRTHEAR